jgi:hypothetical protein
MLGSALTRSSNPSRMPPCILVSAVFSLGLSCCGAVSTRHPAKIYPLGDSLLILAETEGFEPSRGVNPCLVSSEVLSTTQPRLRIASLYVMFRHSSNLLLSEPGQLYKGVARLPHVALHEPHIRWLRS